jgi:hypothetical protein
MATNWKKSVSVRIGIGHADIIRGPVDAFEALNNRWPAEHGPRYGQAKSLCSDAVARGSDDELTRDAFIGAARSEALRLIIQLPLVITGR